MSISSRAWKFGSSKSLSVGAGAMKVRVGARKFTCTQMSHLSTNKNHPDELLSF